jgi:dTDP-4-amino-4,6-dideoxygalactose transaminase
MKKKVPFNKAIYSKNILSGLKKILYGEIIQTAAGFKYFKKCNLILEKKFKLKKCYITNSCTAALEATAIAIDIKPGDEVILPSFTFVSTANAFVLRGAKLVYVDINENNLNINEVNIKKKITKKTKAIIVVHYAGISCDIKKISKLAKKKNIYLIEDAAQAYLSRYDNKYLGTFGDVGCFSFHETKNISSCEGGAIFVNNKKLVKKFSIIVNKGTNRENFERGSVNYYSWKGIGSSYLPHEVTSFILYNQLKIAKKITNDRKKKWINYLNKLSFLKALAILPDKKNFKSSNYHMFPIIFKSREIRDYFLKKMLSLNIQSTFHYIPLHTSSFSKKICNKKFNLPVTEKIYERLLRLPLWFNINEKIVIDGLKKINNSYRH